MFREIEIETPVSVARKMVLKKRFLKGPISLDALATAAKLPAKSLEILLLVHHRCALTRCDVIKLPKALLESFGIDRAAKARALRSLELAGIIRVERVPGHSAVIRLVEGLPA